jgi:hypothetical protein
MAATPKRRRLRAALTRRAEATIGLGATPLDYVERWVANRGLITELAASLQSEMGESMSRGFLSLIVHRLAPDATDRIIAAATTGTVRSRRAHDRHAVRLTVGVITTSRRAVAAGGWHGQISR